MRNLKLVSEARVQSPLSSDSTATCSCICADQGLCVIATDSKLCAISTTSGEVYAAVDLAATGLLPSNSKVISLHCHADACSTEGEAVAVTIAARHGDLLVWHLSTSQVECVGSVESGIAAMCWSPDGEMLVLYTGAATIILMSKEFDPIVENEFHQAQFGSDMPVTVGWGKKETQFHGSEGKAAALTKAEGLRGIVEWDDLQPRVRWRGDGQFFAVLAVDSIEGTRKLRVWGRDGTHHSTSQIVDACIEQALDWKPSGGLIATSQHRLQKHEVIFFERNGLRHGEFVLSFSSKDVQVKEIQWNSDSTVLMVWCEEIENDWKGSYVQLWTMGNYHWYLKQSICTCESDPGILSVTWDAATPLRLHIVGTTGHYTQYNWSWTTSAAPCIYEDCVSGGDASVTVVDGDKLLVTPFKQMTVPPPMSAYSLKVDRVPACIAVAHDSTGAQLRLAAACGKSMFVFGRHENGDSSRSKLEAAGGKGFQAQCQMPSLVKECSFPSAVISQAPSMTSVRHLTWLSDESLAMAITKMDSTASISSSDWLYVMSLVDDGKSYGSTDITLQLEFSVDVGGSVLCIAPLLRSSSEQPCRPSRLAVELLDGTVLCWSRELGLGQWIAETTGRPFKFHVPCPQMAACSLAKKVVLCGLSDTYRFFVDEVEVATDCTSFAIHNDFLLLTTYAHTLRCIRRDCSPDALRQCTEQKAWCLDETIRRVERGSRIVTVVPDDTKVVLQMPRGNLEVVHPRALVLAVVRRALDGRRYREAFDLVRRHRISMNLLYDHDPSAFLDNVVAFVQQIDQIQLLNEFITDLQKENVCSTMYAAYYPEKPAVSTTSTLPSESANIDRTSSKVDVVCDSLYNAFISLNAGKYTLSILAAFAKKTTPELEKALFLIKDLRASRDTSTVAADEALKYLLFLVDVHRLYNVAIGTYDFELALMVAERSHMDPKEYLPFLNEVRPLETNYQRFRIDQHLKRFERALTNLSKCGPERFAECLQFTNEHQLYAAAMMLYPPSSDEYKEVVVCYCKHLIGQKRFEEAGLLYMHVSQYSKAVDCFCESLSWQHLITACHLASSATRGHELPTQLLSSLRRAAGDLRRRRQFLDAARLLELHIKDEEEAVSCLVEGYLWEEALRVAHSSCRPDLEITHIRPAVESAHKDCVATLQGNVETFLQHVRRLRQVRIEKASKSPFESGDIYGPGADEDELFSDAGSSVVSGHISSSRRSGSARSKTSGRSSKNRRKAERKKWSLKEGSPYEELALMEALKQLIEQADAVADDIGRHLRALVLFGHLEEAAALQKIYESALNDMEAAVPNIWPPEAWPCSRHVGGNEPMSGLQPSCSGVLATSNALSASRIQLSERHAGSAAMSAGSDQAAAAAAASFGIEQLIRVPPTIRQKKTWSLPFLRR